MSTWSLAAGTYGLVLTIAAIRHPIRRRPFALAASVAYAVLALAAGTLRPALWASLVVPGVLLLTGYWLSGLYFRDPQPWLEDWLLRVDRTLAADRWMARAPRLLAELLELSYASVYVVIGGGAVYAATFGAAAVERYWIPVLIAELASYAALPWLRSRPPRVVEALSDGKAPGDGTPARREPGGPTLRRLNLTILNNASVQANTLPSGHVAGALAAALAVLPLNAAVGWTLLAVAGLIAVAATAGRYHYAVDCAAGAGVALAVWSLM